jgi:signal peptidase II
MIFIIVILILSLDQFTKFLVNNKLSLYQTIPVIKEVFYISLVHNRGAAFGLFKNQAYLFILTALFAIILIYFSLKESRKVSLYSASLGFILAGTIGNLIDRLRFGYVIDFLDFRIWPVFNIADSAITIGAIVLGWCIIFKKDAS